jgi:hypothetical protein
MNTTDLEKISVLAEKKYLAEYDAYYTLYFKSLKSGFSTAQTKKDLRVFEIKKRKALKDSCIATRAVILAKGYSA